jgi:hypothetical protein
MFFGLAQSIHHLLLEITCSRYNIAEILLTRRSTTITCPLYRLLQLIVYIYIYMCVTEISARPIITGSQADSTTAALGSSTSMSCDAIGFPEPDITWYRKDGEMPR